MAKDFSFTFYHSTRWKKARREFIADRVIADGGMCQNNGCSNMGYIVHHRILLTPSNINDDNITLSKDNLMYVCKDCHDKIHYKEIHGCEPKEKRITFGANGEVIPISPHEKERV